MLFDIKVHKNHPDAVIPQNAYGTSNGIDLFSVENVTIDPGSFKSVDNGLNVTVSEGTNGCFLLLGKSSLTKEGLVILTGLIDQGYTGPLGVTMFNLSNSVKHIKKGQKYAQLLLLQTPTFTTRLVDDEEFEKFKQTQIRGDKGFGSSGKF
jgi:dUTP pyrophosphatase